MKKNLKYIILALVALVFIATFVALWKNCHRDFEQEEQDARDAYYDKILKK